MCDSHEPVPGAAPLEPVSSGSNSSETAILLTYLRTRDVSCPLCGYNLRNLTVPRCPECGREVRLAVGMTEPHMLPWVLTTIFMAMAASIGVLFLAACVAFGLPAMGEIRAAQVAPCLGACWGVAAIPLTLLLVAGRRKIFRWERSAQWSLAAAVFIINALLLVLTLIAASRF